MTKRLRIMDAQPNRTGRVIGSIIALIAVLFGFAVLFGLVR